VELNALAELRTRLLEAVRRVVVGHDQAIDLMLVALLSEGHVLLEGVPGTAKTLLAQSFAGALSLPFKRIQFTPDLMPGDVLGTNVFHFERNQFVLNRGPVFTSILLADEINRTPPKTQSALLEAMQERAVTIDGVTHPLGDAFTVIATQNPIEQEGTYPLPEAQLDRFLFKVAVGYPTHDQERDIVRMHGHGTAMPKIASFGLTPVADLAAVQAARATVAALRLSDPIVDYVVALVRATRQHASLLCGASPRAASMLAAAARARAALEGRDFVIPDDVKQLAAPALAHRLVLVPGSEIEGVTTPVVLQQIVDEVPAPR
jgi:MoxR-like ATPase